MSDTSENKKAFYEDFAEKIISQLKAGTAPWQKPWTPDYSAIGGPVRNPVSGTFYSGVNRINLTLQAIEQGYTDPRWMTFKQAENAGFHIKRGERSTPIIYFQIKQEEKKDRNGDVELDENGEPILFTRPILRFSRVFNASQIEDYPVLTPKETQPQWDPQEKAERVLKNSGAMIYHDQADQNFYQWSTDEIHLTKRGSYDEGNKYYATALHELSHWSGHPSRLNREMAGFGTPTYAREELRAEIASWMIGQDIGVGHDPSQHVAYVGSWIKCLEEDPTEIIRACRDAEKIRDYLLGLDREKSLSTEKVKREENAAVHPVPEEIAAHDVPVQHPALENTYLSVSYVERHEVKAIGARWDAVHKQWYAPKGSDLQRFSRYLSAEQLSKNGLAVLSPVEAATCKTYLFVPYADRHEVKALGARWDRSERLWYAPAGTDLAPLQRFILKDNRKDLPPPQKTESPEQELARKIESFGLDLQGRPIVMDGIAHRCPLRIHIGPSQGGAYFIEGRPGDHPRGWVQNFDTGETLNLVATGILLTEEEKERQRESLPELTQGNDIESPQPKEPEHAFSDRGCDASSEVAQEEGLSL